MPTTRRRFLAALPLLGLLVAATATTSGSTRLPARLADQEFWTLVADLSEPGGSFRSDNLLSNEARLQFVMIEI